MNHLTRIKKKIKKKTDIMSGRKRKTRNDSSTACSGTNVSRSVAAASVERKFWLSPEQLVPRLLSVKGKLVALFRGVNPVVNFSGAHVFRATFTKDSLSLIREYGNKDEAFLAAKRALRDNISEQQRDASNAKEQIHEIINLINRSEPETADEQTPNLQSLFRQAITATKNVQNLQEEKNVTFQYTKTVKSLEIKEGELVQVPWWPEPVVYINPEKRACESTLDEGWWSFGWFQPSKTIVRAEPEVQVITTTTTPGETMAIIGGKSSEGELMGAVAVLPLEDELFPRLLSLKGELVALFGGGNSKAIFPAGPHVFTATAEAKSLTLFRELRENGLAQFQAAKRRAVQELQNQPGITYKKTVERLELQEGELVKIPWWPEPVMYLNPDSKKPKKIKPTTTTLSETVSSPGPLLVVIGGTSGNTLLSSVEQYDETKDEWEDFPAAGLEPARKALGACVLNGKLFVVGGRLISEENSLMTTTPLVQWNDGGHKSWKSAGKLLEPRAGLGVGVTSKGVYAVGGFNNNGILSSVERYDAAKNEWEKISSMWRMRAFSGVGVLDNNLYVLGGYTEWKSGAVESSVERYDEEANMWIGQSQMNTPRAEMGVGVVDGKKLYAVGGLDDDNKPLKSVERYDEAKGKWEYVAEMNIQRAGLSVCVVAGTLYAMGGHDGQNIVSSVERYDEKNNKWEVVRSMGTPRYSGAAVVLPVKTTRGVLSLDE